jgi:hypothetical protein
MLTNSVTGSLVRRRGIIIRYIKRLVGRRRRRRRRGHDKRRLRRRRELIFDRLERFGQPTES